MIQLITAMSLGARERYIPDKSAVLMQSTSVGVLDKRKIKGPPCLISAMSVGIASEVDISPARILRVK